LALTYVDIAERTNIANQVRTAALMAVNGFSLGDALLNQIVDRATDDLNGSRWNQRSMADRLQIAAGIAKEYVDRTAAKPLNFSSATPKELEAQRLALNLALGRGHRGLARLLDGESEGSGERLNSSAAYGRELASLNTGSAALNATFKSLLGEGYSRAQLEAIAPYAQALGWTERRDVRALADAGKEFSALASEYEKARREGNNAEMERIAKEMQERHQKAPPGSKQQKGMEHIFKKQQISYKDSLESGQVPTHDAASPAAAKAKVIKAAKAKSDTQIASDLLGLEDLADKGGQPTKLTRGEPVKPDATDVTDPSKTATAEPVKQKSPGQGEQPTTAAEAESVKEKSSGQGEQPTTVAKADPPKKTTAPVPA
jgi:hypothetical protein